MHCLLTRLESFVYWRVPLYGRAPLYRGVRLYTGACLYTGARLYTSVCLLKPRSHTVRVSFVMNVSRFPGRRAVCILPPRSQPGPPGSCRPSPGSGRAQSLQQAGSSHPTRISTAGTDRARTAARCVRGGRWLWPGSRLSPGEIARTRHAPRWAASPAAADPRPRASGTARHCGPTCGGTSGL